MRKVRFIEAVWPPTVTPLDNGGTEIRTQDLGPPGWCSHCHSLLVALAVCVQKKQEAAWAPGSQCVACAEGSMQPARCPADRAPRPHSGSRDGAHPTLVR